MKACEEAHLSDSPPHDGAGLASPDDEMIEVIELDDAEAEIDGNTVFTRCSSSCSCTC